MTHQDFDTGTTEPMRFSLEPSDAPHVHPPDNAGCCPEWDEEVEKLRGIVMPSNDFLAHHAGCGRCQSATGHHAPAPAPPPEALKRTEPAPSPPAFGWSPVQVAALIVVAVMASLLGIAFVVA